MSRSLLLSVATALTCLGAGTGAFFAGRAGGPNLTIVARAASSAGAQSGAQSGANAGLTAGYRAGYSVGYHHAYGTNYRAAYRRALGTGTAP
jgi:hypothetical protein